MIFLIDECLHPSLVETAQHHGFAAHHVVHLGMSGLTDQEVLKRAAEDDFTLVTNNAVDFRRLYAHTELHAGLVILVPQVVPKRQRELFTAALKVIGAAEPVNAAIEVTIERGRVVVRRYTLPEL